MSQSWDKENSQVLSQKNLERLGYQLAYNYAEGSILDLFIQSGEKVKEKLPVFQKRWLEKVLRKDIKEPNGSEAFGRSIINDSDDYVRNVLVLGAGSSFNAFENIPLAGQAIKQISSGIRIGSILENEEINFDYFIKFCKAFKDDKYNHALYKDSEGLINKAFNEALHEEFQSPGFSYLKETGDKFISELRKWELMNKESGGTGTIDFEGYLNILSSTLPQETVREALGETYSFRHGGTLFYSLVAHLFKHRFIDVIINFNFDELLDEAIYEELGAEGFEMILADGDCRPIDQLTDNGRLRRPLYIKPHGTVSHKSSLRFTKHQYHELPRDIRSLITELISCSPGEKAKIVEESGVRPENWRVNLITAGFELKSMEFNEILANNLPKGSELYNVFNVNDDEEIEKATTRIKDNIKRIFGEKNAPGLYLIQHGDFKASKRGESVPPYETEAEFRSQARYTSYGNLILELFKYINWSFKPRFKPRNIYTHILTAELLHNRNFWRTVNSDKELKEKQQKDEENYGE